MDWADEVVSFSVEARLVGYERLAGLRLERRQGCADALKSVLTAHESWAGLFLPPAWRCSG